MSKLKATKWVAKQIVGWSVGLTVAAIIKKHAQGASFMTKAAINIASFMIGKLVADKAEQDVENTIDDIVEGWKEATEKFTS